MSKPYAMTRSCCTAVATVLKMKITNSVGKRDGKQNESYKVEKGEKYGRRYDPTLLWNSRGRKGQLDVD